MRVFFSALMAFIFVLCLMHPSAQAAATNPRYAALVMDADTGQVLFEAQSRAKRYPASLTKMMTLYMVFDALENGVWKLDTKLTASKKAASQPQTNIALRPGDQITVEQAIKALVTRSANDAAVVLAEGLGKTDWNFGVMMTNKARALGMKDTVFRNPNGLPDSRQHTTAYDMGLLGIALRRDFPQYFHYFTTRSFTYKGRTYGTHNRVLDRFPGVDGIKTGYINASGFNLVSSVKKDGITMVAVVMGGVTAASRDNHMVQLLKKHYPQLAALKQQQSPQYAALTPASAPVPALKPASVPPVSPTSTAAVSGAAINAQMLAKARAERLQPSASVAFAPVRTAPIAPAARPQTEREDAQPATGRAPVFDVSFVSTANAAVRSGTLDYQYSRLSNGASRTPQVVSEEKEWGIQVGAFRSESQAKEALVRAMRMMEAELKDAYMNITSDGQEAAAIHRARLGNLSKTEAETACQKLNAMNAACFPLRIN
jgi:D-alanyl-D-alanine carboxypeptidase